MLKIAGFEIKERLLIQVVNHGAVFIHLDEDPVFFIRHGQDILYIYSCAQGIAQSVACLTYEPEVLGFFLVLIQEGQLSVTGKS